MNWRLILGLGLLAAALLSGWSVWNRRDVQVVKQTVDERSDFVMRDFEMVSLDQQGKESITLRAPSMQRNTTDQSFQIATPLFLLPDTEGNHWELRSATAWISPKADEVRLSGNVKGTSPPNAAVPTTFATEQLNAFPRKHQLTSDAAVTITRPGSILTGVGLEANTQSRQYTILSQVKTRYEPTSAR